MRYQESNSPWSSPAILVPEKKADGKPKVRSLVYDVSKAKHNPVYVAHEGMQKIFDLNSLGHWWPGMRKSIDYVRKCDPCQSERIENL
jgi:transposase